MLMGVKLVQFEAIVQLKLEQQATQLLKAEVAKSKMVE